MSFVCPDCNFRSEFRSALMMHRQLHHESTHTLETVESAEKANARPIAKSSSLPTRERVFKTPSRTASATKLFERFRSKLSRGRAGLPSHLEHLEHLEHPENLELDASCRPSEVSVPSECTSKGLGPALLSRIGDTLHLRQRKTYDCHLCSFVADRITVLDRHLLNDHKIGLESLMKLVMAKTRDGLSCDRSDDVTHPYYKITDTFEDDGGLVIQTVTPKIKILKHASTNTERFDDADGCLGITKDLKVLLQRASERDNRNDFMTKVTKFNDYMNQLFGSAVSLRSARGRLADDEETVFHLGLDERKSSNWDKAFSDSSPRRNKITPRKKLRNEQSYYFC